MGTCNAWMRMLLVKTIRIKVTVRWAAGENVAKFANNSRTRNGKTMNQR